MKNLRYVKIVVLSVIALVLLAADIVRATGPVFISGAQVKGVGNNVSSQEAVSLANDTDEDVDVTGWCVVYLSYSSTTLPSSGGSCVAPGQEGDRVYLKKQQSMTLATNDLTQFLRQGLPTFIPDSILISGLGNTTGGLYLTSSTREVMDSVRWYTSSSVIAGEVNLKPAAGAPENISFQKLVRQDDFVPSPLPLTISYGNLYEVADICRNLAGFQQSIPDGYVVNDTGCVPLDVCDNIDDVQTDLPVGYVQVGSSCVKDMCQNIAGVQSVIPEGMTQQGEDCYHDVCANIDGLQSDMPAGYILSGVDCLPLENAFIRITELLPNVSGTDTGLEFIELFNPFDAPVSLTGYRIEIGKSFEKSFELPASAIILPGEYYVVKSSAVPFTLLNTTSGVRLITQAGDEASSVVYTDPTEDMSWSSFDDGWAYTDHPTPGRQNLRMSELLDDDTGQVAGLATCGPGKYRYPLTNRCRSIAADLSTISSCDADEYRNPETNRCKKLDSTLTSLAPCAENQERNPVTNRCRTIQAGTSVLTPCAEGQERNPETNRCRKILGVDTGSSLASDVQTTQKNDSPYTLSPSMISAGAALLAAGYGVFEWREEALRALRRIAPFLK